MYYYFRDKYASYTWEIWRIFYIIILCFVGKCLACCLCVEEYPPYSQNRTILPPICSDVTGNAPLSPLAARSLHCHRTPTAPR